MTATTHAKSCLADLLREMSGTYAPQDIAKLNGLAQKLKRRSSEEIHGYYLEDGDTVLFTGTDGRISYEIRIRDHSAEMAAAEPEQDRASNVVPFPRRTQAPTITFNDETLDRLEAILRREIENRRTTDVEN